MIFSLSFSHTYTHTHTTSELLNEPFAGNIYKDPFLMVPEQADLKNLQPFYDRLSPQIRPSDPTRLIFFEPVTWSNIAEKGEFGIGFTNVPGGSSYGLNSVLSFHYYDPPNFSISKKGYFQRRVDAAKRLGCGKLLTEFDISGSVKDQSDTMDLCDEFLISWIGNVKKKRNSLSLSLSLSLSHTY